MLYIIPNYYDPNTAATNRMLALLGGLSKCSSEKIVCEVIFFLPNNRRDKIVVSYPNINIKYWWDSPWFFRNKYLKYISYRAAVEAFIRKLKAGDCVLLLGHVELLPWVQKKKGVRVYLEMNEFPEIFHFGNGPFKIENEELLQCCKKLDGLFIISHNLKDYFKEKGVDENRIHLYRMIVDTSRFEGIRCNDDVEPYIAYCGTVTNSKDGVDALLQAFSILKKNYKECIKLYVLGAVPSEKEKHANEKVMEELGITNDVVYKGIVPSEQMPQYLTNAKVLVLARPNNIQAKYGFATKLGEYLLSGNPVVVTTVGDIPLYFNDGENALLAEPDNPQAIADKIQWALTHEDEARVIGLKGREVALKYFNPIIEAENILKVINA